MRLLTAVIVSLCVMTACGEKKKDEHLSTDLVTNPKSASETSGKQAVIKFDKTEHNFGNVLQGEAVTYSFHFTNTGNAPLLISEVGANCGCTVGDFPREPIEPGKGGAIKVSYNSTGHHGAVQKALNVMSNTNPAKTTLLIKATVLTPSQY